MLTLNLSVRPLVRFLIVWCSAALPCSNSLVCGEELTARFLWNF